MTNYQPQPGTIPARAYAWMLPMPKGTEKTSAEIAEELGQPIADIAMSMDYARKRGLFVGRKVGKFIRWSIGDDTVMAENVDLALHSPTEFQCELLQDGRMELMLDGLLFLVGPGGVSQMREVLRGQAS